MIDLVFVDDALQKNPSRNGMLGSLLAIGGIHVPGDKVGSLENALHILCNSIGFPEDEQFKWSPGKKESFERKNLNDSSRIDFFNRIIGLASEHGVTATVVVVDSSKRCASRRSKSHEEDVTKLFLERCNNELGASGKIGLPIFAKPSGGSKDERKFVAECIEIIRQGTEYSDLKNMPLGIVTAPSKQMRVLQLTDVITSCTLSRVSGESQFSPAVFKVVKPIFRRDGNRRGGIGLKIHPDYTYANLYHWLLGDTHWVKGSSGIELPVEGIPYAQSAGEQINIHAES